MKFLFNPFACMRPARLVHVVSLTFVMMGSIAMTQEKTIVTNDCVVKPAPIDAVTRITPKSWGREDLFGADNQVTTEPLDVNRLMAEDQRQKQGPVRTGVCQFFEPVSSTQHGKWTELDNGGWLWTMSFTAAGARSVRLHLASFPATAGADLVAYAPGNPESVRGPMTQSYSQFSDLWTPTIYGSSEIRLEYYLPPEFRPDDEDIHIVVDSLLNNYHPQGGGPEGGPLPCHLDVQCFPQWNLQSSGVGALSFVSNQFGFFCSGAMLNRIGDDLTPLLMTAFHCGVDSSNASSLLVTWFYRTNSCNGTVPNLNTLPQTPGIVLLRNNNPNDFTLVGLSTANTGGVSFLGWTNSSSWNEGSPAVGIHHPRGSWQRIALGSQDGTFDSCIPGADEGWHTLVANGNGLTEPGSSGSPVFDVNFRVRGTLSCGISGCNQENTQTYGRFDQAYPVLQPWLNPADPIYLDAGYNGNEEGTAGQPFNTMLEGVFAVLANSTIHLDAGTYDGPGLVIDKPMTLNSIGGTATIQ